MKWISQVILDLTVLIAVSIYFATDNLILYYTIWAYTCLLILSRIIIFFVPLLKKSVNNTQVPFWFYHLNYALICLFLIFSESYYLLSAWVIVWVLSIIPSPNK